MNYATVNDALERLGDESFPGPKAEVAMTSAMDVATHWLTNKRLRFRKLSRLPIPQPRRVNSMRALNWEELDAVRGSRFARTKMFEVFDRGLQCRKFANRRFQPLTHCDSELFRRGFSAKIDY